VAWRPDSSAYQRFPGVEIEVRGGHIWVQSDYVCTGYLDPDDAGPLHRDGAWATVGDLGRLTADGLDVLGRGDAAVTTGGRTVVVEEVESVLRSSPGLRGRIDDVVVSSIPHPLLGQLLVALVAVDPERPALTRADLDRAAAALPDWSVPRRWWLVDGLPRTPVGKVDRSAVRAGIADGSLTPRPLR
jgi:long-chain acyl-CoA synthetase